MVKVQEQDYLSNLEDKAREAKRALMGYLRDPAPNIEPSIVARLAQEYKGAYWNHTREKARQFEIQLRCSHAWVQVAGAVIECEKCGSSRGD